MDQNAHGRRPHFHRGRRGPDRRGPDRRTPQHQQHAPQEQGGRDQGGRDQVDVEQIMREIRSRISQRHGIELTTQQIQELAARRLEAILDPRSVTPALLEQLRRGAGAAPEPVTPPAAPAYEFENTTLYDTHRGVLRFIRRLLNPILKLFFNPNPLISALNAQARANKEAAVRDAERERRQTEWNALHFDILQRAVTEISRVSLEVQSLALKVESLSAKVDFNERRVRGLENAAPGRPTPPRPVDTPAPAVSATGGEAARPMQPASNEGSSEGTRRRRRRRRGRRGGVPAGDAAATPPGSMPSGDADADDELDEGGDDELAMAGDEADRGVAVPPPQPVEPMAQPSLRADAEEPSPPPDFGSRIAQPPDDPARAVVELASNLAPQPVTDAPATMDTTSAAAADSVDSGGPGDAPLPDGPDHPPRQ